jgi:hypothetical protein
MKKLILLFLIVAGCASHKEADRDTFSLAGEWKFRIDSLDQGMQQKWFSSNFEETVTLPGSMSGNGRGDEVGVNTDWTGDIVDKSYFTDTRYAKYRKPGNIKIPFWLKPVKYYKGVAWYQKSFHLPDNWSGKRIELYLERCHWESTVFVNGKQAGTGISLSTPHRFDITGLLNQGENNISIRIDNRIIVPVGINSHSISDHTQTNWNGIVGEISLRSTPRVYIDEMEIYPDIEKKVAKVAVTIRNPFNEEFKGTLTLQALEDRNGTDRKLPRENVTIVTNSDLYTAVITYKILKPNLWSEFSPTLYKMAADLNGMHGKIRDHKSAEFGMREFKAEGTRFEINGKPVFLRGTTECCIFPLTGYPPTDSGSWEKVLKTFKEYGLNHVRFHSYCPPEAAFNAADKLGIYFHIECSSWANQGSSIGNGTSLDKFIYEEGDRILKEYGNHPSFCMLAYGNEPAGRNQNGYLGKLVNYWKAKDSRRVYTSAAGWPVIPENDYNITSEPRIQHWGQGLKSIINARPPETMFDFSDYVSNFQVPVIGHEIGQWCVYPDLKEISEYTGVLKATNFEIFRETLKENGMADQADNFLDASGKLQVLCYKADIEAALRTPGFAGFEMLQLHDFPGQGTALVGILNSFFESKGYVRPEEFRMFCNETVPLARLPKMVYKNDEILFAEIEIAHFGPISLKDQKVSCVITDDEGNKIYEHTFGPINIEIGNCIPVGKMEFNLEKISQPSKITLKVQVLNTEFNNQWDLWVYPAKEEITPGRVIITDKMDKEAEEALRKGESVLLLPFGQVGINHGAKVAIGFSSIFWNTAWTNNQPPHTLGILCNPDNPVFNDFPTEYHSNWQWWDPVTHSQAMEIGSLPAELKPIIQPIDTWFENRRLALAFEAQSGEGRIFVCSIDLISMIEERPVSRKLLSSILKYMNSGAFNPDVKISPEQIRKLYY